MRIGVISDIHGNSIALDAVLRRIEKDKLDEVVCLGDLAFKGPSPSECVRTIKSLGIPCIFGNTDLYLLSVVDGLKPTHSIAYKPNVAEIPYLQWHTSRMSSSDIDFLSQLPFEYRLEVDGQQLLFVHGAPQDCFSAIQPTDSLEQLDNATQKADADWIFMGHIHRPFVFKHLYVMLVNAGAIGFSLDRDWRASYCIVDTSTKSVCLNRIEYDIADSVRVAKEVDFCFSPDWYGEALQSGFWEPVPYEKRKSVDNFPK